jgi:hypothetical protein
LKATLDELLALAARDPGRVVDFFDRQRPVIAERTRNVPGPSSRDHVQHILPRDHGFLVHLRESFRFERFERQPS